MALPAISLAVVGADYPNRKGPGRRFEIELCKPGEPVRLVLEPKNPADPRAVAVVSARGVQIGYLTAERCGWIGAMIAEGRSIAAIFQKKASFGAVIRAAFDGELPSLPRQTEEMTASTEPESGFYPDFEPPDI